jgi:hypothetical protein
MKYCLTLAFSAGLFLLCACTMFQAKPTTPPTAVPRRTLAVPIGKNWQVIEEAPNLQNERHEQLPFQTEQSVQPAGAKPVSPADQRKIEPPR